MLAINGTMSVLVAPVSPPESGPDWPILICLLGGFHVLKAGRVVSFHGEKVGSLLSYLGLRHQQSVPRGLILETIWPGHTTALAGQSLNSLTYSLRKSLGDEIHGHAPITYEDGCYRLNKEAGVSVDVAWFEALVHTGDQHVFANNLPAAIPSYMQAVQLYHGDVFAGADINAVITRERLRALFLTVLARLADYGFATNSYGRCLHYANRLLENDACREDAHRLVMRCYVRQGERAQALRQYHLCASILHTEFDAPPEQATSQLYDQIRLAPHTI